MTALNVPSGLNNLLSTVAPGTNGAGPAVFWNGGPGLFTVSGVFASGIVTLNYSVDGNTWVEAGAATVEASTNTPPNGIAYLPRCIVQAVVSAATGTTALVASFLPINMGGA